MLKKETTQAKKRNTNCCKIHQLSSSLIYNLRGRSEGNYWGVLDPQLFLNTCDHKCLGVK